MDLKDHLCTAVALAKVPRLSQTAGKASSELVFLLLQACTARNLAQLTLTDRVRRVPGIVTGLLHLQD